MKYMLLVYLDENWEKRPLAERQAIFLGQTKAAEELQKRGQYLAGSPLQPPATATTVRVREGQRLFTDGPFAETREHLGGYMIIDVESLEAALSFAAKGPLASAGTIEVRAMREGPPVV